MIPGAIFFDEVVPDNSGSQGRRYGPGAEFPGGTDLIFFDPDNGIEVASGPKGRKNSSKYLYWDEIAAAFRPKRSLLIYQHYAREHRQAFAARLAGQLRGATGADAVWAVHSPHVLFLLASSDPVVIGLAENLPARFGMRAELL